MFLTTFTRSAWRRQMQSGPHRTLSALQRQQPTAIARSGHYHSPTSSGSMPCSSFRNHSTPACFSVKPTMVRQVFGYCLRKLFLTLHVTL